MTSTRASLSIIERLNLLYRLSQAFNSSLDLSEVLNRVMDEVIAILKAERGFVLLQTQEKEMNVWVARGIDQQTIEDPQFQISRNVIDRTLHEGVPILTADAQLDERFSMRESIFNLGLRSILCVPLLHKEQVIGAIYVDNRLQAGIFTQDDLDLLSAIAANAAVAIENARLYLVAVEKGRMEQELRMAREVQTHLLPDTTPVAAGWEFAARWQPAREVAGDYYDFIVQPGGKVSLFIADVTDKGMPAALFMALSRTIVRASLLHAGSPAEGIAAANRLICSEAASDMFVSMFYAEINLETGECTYVNAGHNPPYWYCAEQDSLTTLTRTGMVMGVEPETEYRQENIQLSHGDFLFCYTDGVTDSLDTQENDFGLERLTETLFAARHSDASRILDLLLERVAEFTFQAVPFDDITLVAAKRL